MDRQWTFMPDMLSLQGGDLFSGPIILVYYSEQPAPYMLDSASAAHLDDTVGCNRATLAAKIAARALFSAFRMAKMQFPGGNRGAITHCLDRQGSLTHTVLKYDFSYLHRMHYGMRHRFPREGRNREILSACSYVLAEGLRYKSERERPDSHIHPNTVIDIYSSPDLSLLDINKWWG